MSVKEDARATDLFALVPIKDPASGKSRLAGFLSEDEREALNILLARRALQACTALFGVQRTLVVAGSAAAADIARQYGVTAIVEEHGQRNVNAAIAAGAECIRRTEASGIIVVPTDLPLLTRGALQDAVAALPAPPGCLLVPDHRGTGTNVVALTPVRSDLFSFGEPSLERHLNLARQAGYDVRIHRSDALEFDLDRPEDYEQLRKTTAWPIFESLIPRRSESPLASIPMSHE
jgi:2-phospho-L-lactate guanylyltransferase